MLRLSLGHALLPLLLLVGCTSDKPPATAQNINDRIVRIGERKSNGIYYSIDDRLPDTTGDIWRVSFKKLFRESGNVYTLLEVRVDPKYNYAISTTQPLQIKVNGQSQSLSNISKDKERIGYYKVDAKTLTGASAQLVLPLGDGNERTITLDPLVIKGWQTVSAIQSPNDFAKGTVTESR